MSTGDTTPTGMPPGVPTPPDRSDAGGAPALGASASTPGRDDRDDTSTASGPRSTPRTAVADAAAAAAHSVASARSDWPAQAADLVVDVVGTVRDKTTTPALTIARGIVYGTAIVFLALTALVLLLIALIRFVDAYLPGEVWSAYLLLGSILTIVGLALWATRRPSEQT